MSDSLVGVSVALVTGASRGIGAAIAHTLANAGAKLTLLGRHADTLQTLAKQLNTETHIESVDISIESAVQQAIANAAKHFGPVHVLVNNTGQASSRISESFISSPPPRAVGRASPRCR